MEPSISPTPQKEEFHVDMSIDIEKIPQEVWGKLISQIKNDPNQKMAIEKKLIESLASACQKGLESPENKKLAKIMIDTYAELEFGGDDISGIDISKKKIDAVSNNLLLQTMVENKEEDKDKLLNFYNNVSSLVNDEINNWVKLKYHTRKE